MSDDGGSAMTSDPSGGEIGIASDVLLWLHECSENGADRDAISFVRHLLDEAEDELS